MKLVNDNFKKFFVLFSMLLLGWIVVSSDRFFDNILMPNFSMGDLFVLYLFFSIIFFIYFFIYGFIPFVKILYNKYGTLVQRVLLILSVLSMLVIFLFVGFGSLSSLYVLVLAIFLNFSSKIVNSNSSSFIISTSSLNIVLMVFTLILMFTTSYVLSRHTISISLLFLFIISSIFYSEKKVFI